jgi:acyl-lipid omega-6 desaturase (Delta-12 desaturase)
VNSTGYRAARAQLRSAGLLTVSDTKGAATVVAELLCGGLLVWALSVTEPWTLSFLLLQVLAGVSIFRWFVILHECGHSTLFARVGVNTAVGHLASIACLIPYYGWRHIHWMHHRWVGVIDKDPTQSHLLRLQRAGRARNALFRLLWRLWLPVPFVVFLVEVFWGYPLRREQGHRAARGWVSNGVCAAPHVLAVAVVGPGAWATFFLPMLVVFYLLIENMNVPQHSELFPYLSDSHPKPLAFAEQDEVTRSTWLPDAVGTVLALNFNRHTEHHMFPGAPWYSLNKVRRALCGSGYRHPFEVPFLRFMWHFRRRDPLVIYRDSLPRPRSAEPPPALEQSAPGPTPILPTTASLEG